MVNININLQLMTAGLTVKGNKLTTAFYERSDVVLIAKELIGKILVTEFDGKVTAGRIVETEAYRGVEDKASHASNGRRTKRTEVMYGAGGVAYVYLCYGIHALFNVVTNKVGIPHAVLIRAVEPLTGIPHMLLRTGKSTHQYDLTRGPGNVTKALGIFTSHSGQSLYENTVFVTDDGTQYKDEQILSTPRVGVDYAGDDALLPYRFLVIANPYVSGRKPGSKNIIANIN